MSARSSPSPLDGRGAWDGGVGTPSDVAAREAPPAQEPVTACQHPRLRPLPHGGEREITLSQAPFDPGALLAAFSAGRSDIGAIVSFTGLCRQDGDVVALELEAYPGFTEAEIARTAEHVAAEHDLLDLHIIHRIGRIAVGEPVVFVATAAAHRRAAFTAADRLMDYLKTQAPFWKREHTADGAARWIEPRAADHADAARWAAPALETPL